MPHLRRLMKDFRLAIEDYGLKDLRYSRSPFTWEKWRREVNWVEECLDRAFGMA